MTRFTTTDYSTMRDFFLSGATAGYKFRKQQLQVLKQAVRKYEAAITEALYLDLHKSAEEAFSTEIGFVYSEITHTLKKLKSWMAPESVKTPRFLFPSTSYIKKEPAGVCLIIAPWNYPFHLLIAPLIGAIAAGNCVVLKPSEITANTSSVINAMISEFFSKSYIRVVEGDGAVVVPELMKENYFDHVFFTGSIPVGRAIALLAAEKLVPVTLELGGKSPCIVDEGADLAVAAKRIVWGKFTNAGQTCVAPDYLLVHEESKAGLVGHMQNAVEQFYGSNPLDSEEYGRIVNKKRLEKLKSFLDNGKILTGGHVASEQLYISPTIMDEVELDAPVMNEEIFGPILPIITFKRNEDALQVIKKNPNPLSLYYFGNNKANERLFIDNVQFGGGCVNNTLVHLANADLPFGGVGNSGVGAYHGKFSFDTFSRTKAILKTATWVDPAVKYPPYKGKLKYLKWLFR